MKTMQIVKQMMRKILGGTFYIIILNNRIAVGLLYNWYHFQSSQLLSLLTQDDEKLTMNNFKFFFWRWSIYTYLTDALKDVIFQSKHKIKNVQCQSYYLVKNRPWGIVEIFWYLASLIKSLIRTYHSENDNLHPLIE